MSTSSSSSFFNPQPAACSPSIVFTSETASSRPFHPTIHVLVLPSQIPIDLKLGIRDLDEAWLVRGLFSRFLTIIWINPQNNGDIPNHLNLISYEDAMNDVSYFADIPKMMLMIQSSCISKSGIKKLWRISQCCRLVLALISYKHEFHAP